ncbi:O-antigen ligase family protein [Kordiimonas aquimaris]|uniref:O-antigen ligase family protein n=1 Tax=Kordiimonas aquimaris TaxID=707591 RepID=UPI0021D316A2|nr:O-antigen ligase family protein [Kordiimonas aquimaris]
MRFLIYMLLALSALPFASARPTWQWTWVIVVGLIACGCIVRSYRNQTPSWPLAISLPASLAMLFVVWGFIQAYFYTAAGASIAGLASTESISVNPALTVSNTIYFLSHLVFFLCVFSFCSRRDKAVNILKNIGIIIAIYAAYGFIIYVSGNDTILWFKKWANLNSLTSTFVNRNSFASYAAIGLQCLIAYAFFWAQDELAEGRTGRELYRHILETMMVKAWWLPLAIFLTASALLLTSSRAGFSAAVAGVFILLLLSPNRYKQEGGGTLKAGLIVIGFIVLSGSIFTLSGEILDQRLQADATLDMRFKAYPYMINAIMDSPLTGFGLGTFDEVFQAYRGPDVIVYFDRAHSDYLEIALTAGIPAAIILVLACIMPIFTLSGALKYGAQHRSFIALGISVTIQLGLHALVDFSLQMPAVSYTWLAVLAASMAIAIRCKRAAQS